MRIGVVFPHNEIGNDPAVIRDYVQAIEGLGFRHLLAFDHVLGANPASYPDIKFLYTHKNAFHEIFVLFGFLAAATRTLELASGVLVLSQRQTALVAKQAAAIDVLSGGRLRLGVGVGWNPVEFVALGENFHDRGKRIEEQIAVLRALWTKELVNFTGRWHTIRDAGLNPLPVQRPIPIWLGGQTDPVIRRVARVADGWIPGFYADKSSTLVETMHRYAREAGRDPAAIKIERIVELRDGTPESWHAQIAAYRAMGVTHIAAAPMNAGLTSAAAHIAALERFKDAAAAFAS